MNWLREEFKSEVLTVVDREGWDQDELARRSGITPSSVSRILRDKSEGSLESWSRLLRTVREITD